MGEAPLEQAVPVGSSVLGHLRLPEPTLLGWLAGEAGDKQASGDEIGRATGLLVSFLLWKSRGGGEVSRGVVERKRNRAVPRRRSGHGLRSVPECSHQKRGNLGRGRVWAVLCLWTRFCDWCLVE
jgi:hypothetical protein